VTENSSHNNRCLVFCDIDTRTFRPWNISFSISNKRQMIIINTIHRDREKKHLWYFPSKGSSHIILWICISYCCCCTSSAVANLASTLVTFAVLTNFDVLYKDYKPLYSYNAVALSALSYYSNKPRMARCRSVSVLLWLFQKVLDLHALATSFSFHNFSSQQHRKQHLQYCGYMCSKSLIIPLMEHL
jgi:hypothetical protein